MIRAAEQEEAAAAGTIGVRVFVYATFATVAVSLALAFAFGVALAFSMHEVYELRAAAAEARASSETCRMQAARVEGKLEQYDKWVTLVREGKRPLVGGVGGP